MNLLIDVICKKLKDFINLCNCKPENCLLFQQATAFIS